MAELTVSLNCPIYNNSGNDTDDCVVKLLLKASIASSLGKLNDVTPEPTVVEKLPEKINSGKLIVVKDAEDGIVNPLVRYFKSG